MTEITIAVPDEVAARLAVLTDPSLLAIVLLSPMPFRSRCCRGPDRPRTAGCDRPGAWEREWLCQAFGYDWTARLVPDTRPEMLSGDGRVIFDRPAGEEDSRE